MNFPSPSGTPPATNEPWTRDVEWVSCVLISPAVSNTAVCTSLQVRGNVLEPPTYQSQLVGASAVISCVGGFGSEEEMLKVIGKQTEEGRSLFEPFLCRP